MSNPVLQSESFERAAYSLGHAMDNMRVGAFTEAVSQFDRSVQKLGMLMGMQAKNALRDRNGQAAAYTEQDFFNA